MNLAFIILAHDHPQNLFRLVNRLTTDGDLAVIHWDKKNKFDIRAFFREKMSDEGFSNVRFSQSFDVRWGKWSMVEATLACLEQVKISGRHINYVTLLSGSDYPISSLSHLKEFLRTYDGLEYIECVDPDKKRWVTDGLSKERYEYRHWANWRTHRKLFNTLWKLQRWLGLKRKMPGGLKAHFGSQWWTLTWNTANEILSRSKLPYIRRFFKSTWVPDELFFQTMVPAIVSEEKIAPRRLSFYHFTPQGVPVVFYNDHLNFLLQQNYFFARKISPYAEKLMDALDAHIEGSAACPLPPLKPRNHAEPLDCFLRLQYRGIPNTRVIGNASDPWYGDLEWNRLPYFVILSPAKADIEPLRRILNQHPRIRCYCELFDPDRINYALPGAEHPSYPENNFYLRDIKNPNFLCDMIHLDPTRIIGCVISVPSHNEMADVVIYDPRALIIACLPNEDKSCNAPHPECWSKAADIMETHDCLTKIQKAGKTPIVIRLTDYKVTDEKAQYAMDEIKDRLIKG